MSKYFKIKNGFTLVETLIALSIFSVSIVALMSVLGGGIYNANYAQSKMVASYLAQEGIEYIRNMRDNYVLFTDITGNDWNDFLVANKSYSTGDPKFTRTIQMTTVPSNPDEVKISSTVSFTVGSGPYSVVLSESLFNWAE